jgi:hypothetical protein
MVTLWGVNVYDLQEGDRLDLHGGGSWEVLLFRAVSSDLREALARDLRTGEHVLLLLQSTRLGVAVHSEVMGAYDMTSIESLRRT